MSDRLVQKIQSILGEEEDFCQFLAEEILAVQIKSREELWNILSEHLQPLASSKGLINPRFASDAIWQAWTEPDVTSTFQETFRKWLHDPTASSAKLWTPEIPEDLTASGGQLILDKPNAGGTSEASEALSFQILHSLLGARLLATEMELQYEEGSKMTDYLVDFNSEVKIGVSVTRMIDFYDVSPRGFGEGLSEEGINRLVVKKLQGILASTEGVSQSQKWTKQILHMFCTSAQAGAKVEALWDSALASALKADTLLLLTVSQTDLTEPLLVTIAKVRLHFSKEILRRTKAKLGDLDLPPEALSCYHSWFGDLLGGLRCQICAQQTTARVWKCRTECGIALCGFCCHKWQKKFA